MTAQTKIVPIEPTEEMVRAAMEYQKKEGKAWSFKGTFQAMLDAAPACAAEPDVEQGLKFAMYSDVDECIGDIIEEYVQNRTVDLTDELELQAGQEFYVDACYYRPEKWRLLERPAEANPNAIIRCERVDAPLFAATPDFQAGLEVQDCGCPPGKCCARRKTDEDTCRMTPSISPARKEGA